MILYRTAFGLTLALPFSILMALWPKAYKVPQSQPQKQEKWPVLAKMIKMNDLSKAKISSGSLLNQTKPDNASPFKISA